MQIKRVFLAVFVIFSVDFRVASANCRGRVECSRNACVLGNILQLLVKYLERDDHHDACATINTFAANINKTLNNTDAAQVCTLCTLCKHMCNMQRGHPHSEMSKLAQYLNVSSIREVYATMARTATCDEKFSEDGDAADADCSALAWQATKHAQHARAKNKPGNNRTVATVSLQLDSCQGIDHCRRQDAAKLTHDADEKTIPTACLESNDGAANRGRANPNRHADDDGGSALDIVAQSAGPNANRSHNDRGGNAGQVQHAQHAQSQHVQINDDRSTSTSIELDANSEASDASVCAGSCNPNKNDEKIRFPDKDDFVYVTSEFSSGEHNQPNVKYTIRPGPQHKREYSDVELLRLAKMLNNRDFYAFLTQKKLLI